MPEDRIARLSQRFQAHGLGRRPSARRSRERHSFYLDGAIVEQVASTYRDVNHALHPRSITKSDFLEALLVYGLSHLAEITALLTSARPGGAEAS